MGLYPKLFIVDDEEDIRIHMKWALGRDYEVLLAEDRRSAREMQAREQPHLATLDLGLPPRPGDLEEGHATLKEMLCRDPFLKVIIIRGPAEREHGLTALAEGAYSILCKPVPIGELKAVLTRAASASSFRRGNHLLQKESGSGGEKGTQSGSNGSEGGLKEGKDFH